MAFIPIRQSLERNIEKYEKAAERNKENGLKGGRPKTQKTQPVFEKPKKADNDNVPVPDNVPVSESDFVNSSEPASGPPQANKTEDADIFISFLLNDGSEYAVTSQKIGKYAELYPAVNVEQELRNITAWCLANAKKRKTRSGAEKFMNGWLSRAQNEGGGAKNGNTGNTSNAGNGTSGAVSADGGFGNAQSAAGNARAAGKHGDYY